MAFPPPQPPFSAIQEPFKDVFFVTGGFRFGPGIGITRNMTVVREGGALTVINSVRLDADGEAALDKLGKVEHLVRLGAFHGADDLYYVDRYKPTLWAPPKTKHPAELKTDKELAPGACPIKGASVFLFDHAKQPEGALLLERDGGLLITVDSYQNWESFEGCTLIGKVMMKLMGFGPTLIGGPWFKAMGPEVRTDFEELVKLPFSHLVPAHGQILKDTAKEGLRTAMARRFKG
jgi:hypothetical protein